MSFIFLLSLSLFFFSSFKTRAISLTGATDIRPHFETGRWWVGLIFWTNDRWITDRWVFYGGCLGGGGLILIMWSNGHEVEIVARKRSLEIFLRLSRIFFEFGSRRNISECSKNLKNILTLKKKKKGLRNWKRRWIKSLNVQKNSTALKKIEIAARTTSLICGYPIWAGTGKVINRGMSSEFFSESYTCSDQSLEI